MSPAITKIFHQAERTFSILNKDGFKANLITLKKYVDQLQLSDVDELENHVTPQAFRVRDKAPCSYLNICERERFTMSVFIINNGYTMPLHDHPKMIGMLKVISGRLKIQSYTRIYSETSDELIVTPEEPKICDKDTESSILDEHICNYHEITAIGGPAAFFDILSPPYSDYADESETARHCHFYRKIMVENNHPKKIKLEKINCPDHYFCDSIVYQGLSRV